MSSRGRSNEATISERPYGLKNICSLHEITAVLRVGDTQYPVDSRNSYSVEPKAVSVERHGG